MASLRENRELWSTYDWKDGGSEWSSPWGTSAILWHGSIFPRIAAHLPCDSLLEIAPGFGRVTRFLLPWAKNYVGVDIVECCVRKCREEFGEYENQRFVVGDGETLGCVQDGSVSFAFSWDSLVHADEAVLAAYAAELGRKLTPGGRAFIHHSNVGGLEYEQRAAIAAANVHKRDLDMSAEVFRGLCADAGLLCVAQEVVAWVQGILTDAFSLCVRPSGRSEGQRATSIREHYHFMDEADNLRTMWQMSQLALGGVE